MTDPKAPRPHWRPTAGWRLKRIVATAAPVLLLGYFIAYIYGYLDRPKWGIIVWFAIVGPLTILWIMRRSRRIHKSRNEGP